jgi:hypothetical protein
VSSESVCQAARSWVELVSFYTLLVVKFMIFTPLIRILKCTSEAATGNAIAGYNNVAL